MSDYKQIKLTKLEDKTLQNYITIYLPEKEICGSELYKHAHIRTKDGKNMFLTYTKLPNIQLACVNSCIRTFLGINSDDIVEFTEMRDEEVRNIDTLVLTVKWGSKISSKEIEGKIFECCMDKILQQGYIHKMNVKNKVLEFIVNSVSLKDGYTRDYGVLTKDTEIIFNGDVIDSRVIKLDTISPETLGVGGMEEQFDILFNKVFMSRIVKKKAYERLGVKHVKGVLLYGPPGCGKTMLARNIGRIVNCEPPIIVNGPEILNKYVGQSEENIRNLFLPAEQNPDKLYMIILDEIDAICRPRGSEGTSSKVNDSLVNQLLSKIDGINSLNNIIIIGMTNRIDLIDDAMKRPGRLEVHIEVGLPDKKGRIEIFTIHTKQMRENKVFGDEVDLLVLSDMTNNYTGAEIESVVKIASSIALRKVIDINNIAKTVKNADNVQLIMEDFIQAVKDVKPMFGGNTGMLYKFLSLTLNTRMKNIVDDICTKTNMFMMSNVLIYSILLHGSSGCGKTTVASYLTKNVKVDSYYYISAENTIEMSEREKVGRLLKICKDADKTEHSLVIIDDVDILIEYSDMIYSNKMFQTVKTLLRMIPTNKIIFVLCTNNYESLDRKGLFDKVDVVYDLCKEDKEESEKESDEKESDETLTTL
jgi:vesicle-fusing ATPase